MYRICKQHSLVPKTGSSEACLVLTQPRYLTGRLTAPRRLALRGRLPPPVPSHTPTATATTRTMPSRLQALQPPKSMATTLLRGRGRESEPINSSSLKLLWPEDAPSAPSEACTGRDLLALVTGRRAVGRLASRSDADLASACARQPCPQCRCQCQCQWGGRENGAMLHSGIISW